MNAMHSSKEIIDEFYPVLNDGEVQSRISTMGKETSEKSGDQEMIRLLRQIPANPEEQAK